MSVDCRLHYSLTYSRKIFERLREAIPRTCFIEEDGGADQYIGLQCDRGFHSRAAMLHQTEVSVSVLFVPRYATWPRQGMFAAYLQAAANRQNKSSLAGTSAGQENVTAVADESMFTVLVEHQRINWPRRSSI